LYVRIDVLIYSAAQMQERLTNLLTYLLTCSFSLPSSTTSREWRRTCVSKTGNGCESVTANITITREFTHLPVWFMARLTRNRDWLNVLYTHTHKHTKQTKATDNVTLSCLTLNC